MTYPSIRLEGLPSNLEWDLLPKTSRNLRIVSSGVKSSSRWLPVWESATRSPTTSNVCPSMKLAQRLSTAWQFKHYPHNLRSPSKPGHAKYCTISGAIRGTSTISLIKTESITIKLLNLLFRHDKRERRFTAPGFSTLTPLPGPNMGELPPITISTFTTRSPNNTSLANHVSTSANPNPVISSAFVEANYEVLESILKDSKRQVRNEDIRTKLDYYSEEQRRRVVEFEEAPNRDGSRAESDRRPSERRVEDCRSHGGNLPPILAAHLGRSDNGQSLQSTLTSGYGGNQPYINLGGNLPPNSTYLSHNAPPFIPNSIQPPSNGQMPSYVNPYAQTDASMTYNQPSSYPFHTQGSNPFFRGVSACHPYGGYTQKDMSNYGPNHNGPMYHLNVLPTSYPFYAQPINSLPKANMYQAYGPAGLFADSTGCVTPFAGWIEDYPRLDGLKMPPHVDSYDRKRDPNNYLHIFERAICMQKWAMLVACHMFTCTLKDPARIWLAYTLAYASLIPLVLSFPLYMPCDDSDGCMWAKSILWKADMYLGWATQVVGR
ncbi:hypothetical protein Tco_1040594 [Tanacetum coccineum]